MELRTVSVLFGISRSTVGEIVLDTCDAIMCHLLPKYVSIPQGDSLHESMESFECRWGFPHGVGTMDGSYIPIQKPVDSAFDYFNHKCHYFVLMQTVVDFRDLFMDINIGWPGKVYDARVFANSSLYLKGSNGTLLPNWKCINGVDVPLLILEDLAYPLIPWLMNPYLEKASTTAKERNYKYRQSRARMVVENAFGQLKGRWRCLLKRLDVHVSNIPNVIGSCVVLHNICEIFGDHFWEDNIEVIQTRSSSASVSTTSSTTADIQTDRHLLIYIYIYIYI